MESSFICIDRKCYINNKIFGIQEGQDAHKNHDTMPLDNCIKQVKDGSHPIVKLQKCDKEKVSQYIDQQLLKVLQSFKEQLLTVANELKQQISNGPQLPLNINYPQVFEILNTSNFPSIEKSQIEVSKCYAMRKEISDFVENALRVVQVVNKRVLYLDGEMKKVFEPLLDKTSSGIKTKLQSIQSSVKFSWCQICRHQAVTIDGNVSRLDHEEQAINVMEPEIDFTKTANFKVKFVSTKKKLINTAIFIANKEQLNVKDPYFANTKESYEIKGSGQYRYYCDGDFNNTKDGFSKCSLIFDTNDILQIIFDGSKRLLSIENLNNKTSVTSVIKIESSARLIFGVRLFECSCIILD